MIFEISKWLIFETSAMRSVDTMTDDSEVHGSKQRISGSILRSIGSISRSIGSISDRSWIDLGSTLDRSRIDPQDRSDRSRDNSYSYCQICQLNCKVTIIMFCMRFKPYLLLCVIFIERIEPVLFPSMTKSTLIRCSVPY